MYKNDKINKLINEINLEFGNVKQIELLKIIGDYKKILEDYEVRPNKKKFDKIKRLENIILNKL